MDGVLASVSRTTDHGAGTPLFQPKLSYARNGDINIAYQAIGEGPLDLLVIPPFVSHLDL